MKKVFARDFGILPNAPYCQAELFRKMFSGLEADTEIVLEKGRYKLHEQVVVQNIQGLTINGNGAVFEAHVTPDMLDNEVPGLFHFIKCDNLKLYGFDIDTDNDIGVAGTVETIDIENGSYDLRLLDGFKMTGTERLASHFSYDDELTPDGSMKAMKADYSVIEDGLIRILPDDWGKAQLKNLKLGHKIWIRHTIYATELLIFTGCHKAEISDINVYSCPGIVVRIIPHCSDFTFRRFNVILPEGSNRLMASNADGIHIKGMSGEFLMEDCRFEQLGDDALNVHSRFAIIKGLDLENNKLVAEDGYDKTPLFTEWASAGDIIEVYDKKTATVKGELVVAAFDGENLSFKNLSGEIAEGDGLANLAYYPKVRIRRCTVKNTRARAFLLRSRDMIIEDCYTYGMALAAFLICPDIERWFEAGTSRNVFIRNNKIEKCAYNVSPSNVGAITVKSCDDVAITDHPSGVHKNIVIENNEFLGISAAAIYVSATDKVKVSGNNFISCSQKADKTDKEYWKYEVVARNCTNIEVSNNISPRNDYHLFCETI